MSELSDLLQKANQKHGWSTREIENRAAQLGHTLSFSTASRYLSGKHPSQPSFEVLDALAAVFGMDVNTLREVAGLPGDASTPYQLPAEAARLTGEQRKAIDAVVWAFLNSNATQRREIVTKDDNDQNVYRLAARANESRGRVPDDGSGDNPGA